MVGSELPREVVVALASDWDSRLSRRALTGRLLPASRVGGDRDFAASCLHLESSPYCRISGRAIGSHCLRSGRVVSTDLARSLIDMEIKILDAFATNGHEPIAHATGEAHLYVEVLVLSESSHRWRYGPFHPGCVASGSSIEERVHIVRLRLSTSGSGSGVQSGGVHAAPPEGDQPHLDALLLSRAVGTLAGHDDLSRRALVADYDRPSIAHHQVEVMEVTVAGSEEPVALPSLEPVSPRDVLPLGKAT